MPWAGTIKADATASGGRAVVLAGNGVIVGVGRSAGRDHERDRPGAG